VAISIETHLAVHDLLARYVHAIDDGRLEEWPEFFAENGRYRITTAENHERGWPLSIVEADSRAMLRDRVSALRHANIYEPQRYRHSVSSTLIDVEHGHSVRAVSCFHVLRIMQAGDTSVFASGRYIDRIRLAPQPAFEERLVILDSRSVDTLLALPL
jgi:anthranilate 1,2-dioxygenase small subunit